MNTQKNNSKLIQKLKEDIINTVKNFIKETEFTDIYNDKQARYRLVFNVLSYVLDLKKFNQLDRVLAQIEYCHGLILFYEPEDYPYFYVYVSIDEN